MVAEVKEVMTAAAELVHLAAARAPESVDRSFLEPLASLAQALPLAVSPRVEGLRQTLVQLGQTLGALEGVSALAALEPDDHGSLLQGLEPIVVYVARFFAAARARVGLARRPRGTVGGRGAARARGRHRRRAARPGGESSVSPCATPSRRCASTSRRASATPSRACSPALGEVPRDRLSDGAPVRPAVADAAPRLRLPGWLPPSRLLGGFYIQRPISSGAAGSVFVAQRAHERHEDDAESYALKVPRTTARTRASLTEQEFLHSFREIAAACRAWSLAPCDMYEPGGLRDLRRCRAPQAHPRHGVDLGRVAGRAGSSIGASCR